MTTTAAPLRLAVAAAPPVLAGALRAILADERTEVVLVLSSTSTPFDVAIVVPGCDIEVDAPVRIVLDDAAASRGGGLVTRGGVTVAHLPDLGALVAYVRALATTDPRAGAHA